ncbi:uncharacterized protein LOC128552525 [Mercenaria mercenaria]|uniref:uncharacterized protein LOC128552525 n=1 Tax=Mercenaria mercenaria TaxID=6596 RepID=UPI00234EE50B|nr:uncharacterized protein LOC128552525 [Mercenaria mercenaria]
MGTLKIVLLEIINICDRTVDINVQASASGIPDKQTPLVEMEIMGIIRTIMTILVEAVTVSRIICVNFAFVAMCYISTTLMVRMSRDPDCYQTESLKLSEVLNDIGVDERMILKTRRMKLLQETIGTSTVRLLGFNISIHNFGSQSEGSTTLGLQSDTDSLYCQSEPNVIKDWDEWQLGRYNLLMIQDETTSPGYCLLQLLREDEPRPFPTDDIDHLPGRYFTASRGKVLTKNTLNNDTACLARRVINGPALSIQGSPGLTDQDQVPAFHCKSWPAEARPWLSQEGIGKWPTEDMKRYCETTGCLVVPVSSKNGQNEQLEWRISTSQAERCLMFSLNITQLRCYILMKMILKTSINPHCDGVLSSFMCKTVLFHCIQNTRSNNWVQSNLLECLMCCLTVLQNFVRQENCPHFVIPKNNLMAGRISPHNKLKILEILQKIIQSKGSALLEIPIDDLGIRLQVKTYMGEAFQYPVTPAQMYAEISSLLLLNFTGDVSRNHSVLLKSLHDGNEMVCERLSDFTLTLTRMYRAMGVNSLEKSAVRLLAPLLSSSLGSVIASHNIYTTHSISSEALGWFSAGLNSDVASGRLKLASALYCVGDMERAEFVLRNIEEKYDLNTVEPVCQCYDHLLYYPRQGFSNKCTTGNEEVIKHNTAFCVKFLRCEICSVPEELQYEMLRSTQEDRFERDEMFDNWMEDEFLDSWMDWAVVDSLPYLYFLQYKTYGALQRVADQQCALANLVTSIETESNLGHRETTLNLLGQCMEQENRHTDALRCYLISLNIRARNNAANFLFCRLLDQLFLNTQ